MQELKRMFAAGKLEEAYRRLVALARKTKDYPQYSALCRQHKRLRNAEHGVLSNNPLRVALLGGGTTELLEGPLALALAEIGFDAVIHQSDYNTFAQEMLNPASATAAFKPDVGIVINLLSNMPQWPAADWVLERVQQCVDEVCSYWLDLCGQLHAHAGCDVILNNFHLLTTRPTGNLNAKLPWDHNNFILRLNLALGDRAPSYVHVNDVAGIASRFGIYNWHDPRYWYLAKQPVSFECLVPYVRNTAQVVGAILGRTAKCLVLDLDNTLWGGVVGDDGVDGIRVGPGDPVGEAFAAFQEYVVQLKDRGVLLAVCSKNDESNAMAPFSERPEMALHRDDFVSFHANWRPKPENLHEIASELNIGLDSLVFVDDNPAEREHVRLRLPEVRVVELTDDPADYPRLLDETGWFEVVALSDEDRQRSRQYKANAARDRMRESVSEYEGYLRALEQRAVIRPFEEPFLDRITQLINKSNQFNLTTKRMTRSQVEDVAQDPKALSAYVRLADRFGDNGLISVFYGREEGDDLWIELWLMSCRVLQRGVEQLLCSVVVEWARDRAIETLRGLYIPTVKNGLVRDHYESLGFQYAGKPCDTEKGTTLWTLRLEDYEPPQVAVQLVEDY